MEPDLREEPLDSATARPLLEAFSAEIAGLYPGWTPGAGPSASPEDFGGPAGTFLIAYVEGRAVGCGGLKRLDAGHAEIKRVYVVPDARGAGLGRILLEGLEEAALARGYSRVRLDTGDRQPPALALFRSAGYSPIDDYNGNTFASHWLEKRLAGAGEG